MLSPFLQNWLRSLVLLLLCSSYAVSGYASHIYGMDLYYSHVSGNTYIVYLAAYGDCSGSAFSLLPGSTPQISIYNGNTFVSNINLSILSPSGGVEVSPVCPAQMNNTQCTNITNPLPGVKKFLYSDTVTLSGASTQWRFVFTGNMGGSTIAGRSTSITNVAFTSGRESVIYLVDTLNNLSYGSNSSPSFTGSAAPYLCISSATTLSLGAIDPNGDSLSYYLVSASDTVGRGVTYIAPYSGVNPLAASSFSFSNSTGQIAVTPNAVQKSVLVYNVREKRGGILVGTSQRETTVIVLGTCSNNAPVGVISGISGGVLETSTRVKVCNRTDTLRFSVNPTDADGDSIMMSIAGLPGSVSYSISNNNTPSPTCQFVWEPRAFSAGTYTFYVTLKDSHCPLNSTQVIPITIIIAPSPVASYMLLSSATCSRRAGISLIPSGTSAPFRAFLMQGSVTLGSYTGLTGPVTDSFRPGTYLFRVYNTDNCIADTAVVIASPPLPSGEITAVSPLCNGDSSGSIRATGTGGTSPYQYALGSGSYTDTGSYAGLIAGSYLLHIRDDSGCTLDTPIVLNNPAPILTNIAVRRPACNGINSGRVVITAFNSVSPYSYAKDTGSYTSTGVFDSLAAGTYTFHIRNGVGCIIDTMITLTDSVRVDGTVTISPIRCNGGTAGVTIAGTVGYGSSSSYSYALGSGSFGPFGYFTLSAGSHVLHLLDSLNCQLDTTITLSEPTRISITTTLRDATCYGTATGTVFINATGGTPSYTYALDGGTYSVTRGYVGLAAGSHVVRVKDTNNCIVTDTITISQPPPVTFDSILFTPPVCVGDSNGTITIAASGGRGTYRYAIDSRSYSTSSVITGISAGAHVLHISDSAGCIADSTYTMPSGARVIPLPVITHALCATLGGGRVVVNATGGHPGYSYAIGSGGYSTVNTFTGLATGTYTFHIRDTMGCTADTVISIIGSRHVIGIFNNHSPLCYNDSNGSITLTGAGGSAPYTYALGSGGYSTIDSFPRLRAGSYTLHIRDSTGCVSDTVVTLNNPQQITANLTLTTPSCFGSNNGSISVAARGGVPGYTYSLNSLPFGSTTLFTGLYAGMDTIRIKDSLGCQRDTIVSLTQPSPLVWLAVNVTPINCFGGASGIVTGLGGGGTSPYTYAIDAGAFSAANTFTGLTAGSHTLHIKDSKGCVLDSVLTLTQPPLLRFTGAYITQTGCEGENKGVIIVFPTGGTFPYMFSTDNVNFSYSPRFNNQRPGTHTIYMRDTNGCTADTNITLIGYPPIRFNQVLITTPLCAGNTNGKLSVDMSGGVPPFSYTVNAPHTNPVRNIIEDLKAGIYILTATDSAGCKRDTTIHLTEPDSLQILAEASDNDCMGYDDSGMVKTTTYGGTLPYSYIWNNSSLNGLATAKGLANGKYRIIVKDAHECTDTVYSTVGYANCCTPYIPNAFSPNNDGSNDVFRLRFKGDVRIISFIVFDRYGNKVFKTEYAENGWDGTYRGAHCDIGTYFYYLRYICGDERDKVIDMKGDVILIR